MYQQKGRFNRGGGDSAAPVNVGEELDVKIEAVGEKGDGIAKKNGFVIFVPGAKEGQTVHIKITRVLKKMAFSEVVAAGASSQSGEQASKESGSEDFSEGEEEFSGEDSEDFGEGENSEEEWK